MASKAAQWVRQRIAEKSGEILAAAPITITQPEPQEVATPEPEPPTYTPPLEAAKNKPLLARPEPWQAESKTATAPDWDEETGTLAKWIAGITEDDLPAAPFMLDKVRKVANAGGWLAALKADISRGPRGARARMGAIQEDMKILARLVLDKEDPC